ncbi:MAG: hypothetical protein ABR915_15425, partial [Thermoguttaceae bacterium]
MRSLACMTLFVGSCLGAAQSAEPRTWTLTNPTGREYANELVRLKIDLPKDFDPAKWTVLEDGQPVPAQAEQIDGKTFVWVAASLSKGQRRQYTLENRAPEKSPPRVTVRREGDFFVLDNGLTAVRLPAVLPSPAGRGVGGDGGAIPPPIAAVRLPGGKWVGKGHWHTDRQLKAFDATIVGDGTLFGKVRLEYRLEGVAGLDAVPAFYRAEIALPLDRSHVVLEEAFEMSRGSYWEFDAASGWAPRAALCIPHGGGAGQGVETKGPDGKPYVFPPVTLDVG